MTDFVNFGGLQIGGSYRQYDFFDSGNMSNTEEINKVHGELMPWEYAVFVQSTKWFFNERFKLQGALRLDDSDSYGKNLAPSFSTVLKTLEKLFCDFLSSKHLLILALYGHILILMAIQAVGQLEFTGV